MSEIREKYEQLVREEDALRDKIETYQAVIDAILKSVYKNSYFSFSFTIWK